MKVEEFVERLRAGCHEFELPSPFTDEKRPGTIKLRIKLVSHLHISIYFNEDTGTLTSALIRQKKRIFGYDAYPSYNIWHVHPLHDVENHKESEELSIEEIARLYSETLANL